MFDPISALRRKAGKALSRLVISTAIVLACASLAQAQATIPVGGYVNAQGGPPSPARAALAAQLYARIRDRNDQAVMQGAQRLAGDTAKRVDIVNPGKETIASAICNRDFSTIFAARLPDFDRQMTAVIASVFSDGEVAAIRNAAQTNAPLPAVTQAKFTTDMGVSNASLVWLSQVTSENVLPQIITDLRANNLAVPQEMTQVNSNSPLLAGSRS